jgi:hypothetical protein
MSFHSLSLCLMNYLIQLIAAIEDSIVMLDLSSHTRHRQRPPHAPSSPQHRCLAGSSIHVSSHRQTPSSPRSEHHIYQDTSVLPSIQRAHISSPALEAAAGSQRSPNHLHLFTCSTRPRLTTSRRASQNRQPLFPAGKDPRGPHGSPALTSSRHWPKWPSPCSSAAAAARCHHELSLAESPLHLSYQLQPRDWAHNTRFFLFCC